MREPADEVSQSQGFEIPRFSAQVTPPCTSPSLPHVKQLLRPTGGVSEVIDLNMELEAGPSSSSRRRYVIEMRPDSWHYIPVGEEEDHGDVGPAGDAPETP